jgi:cytochrome c peroxidase
MASAARTASRAFLRSTPATSSFRPAARSTRFALPQGLRASARRGYSSDAGSEKSSSSAGIWAFGIAALGAGGAYLYLNGASPKGPFVPTQADYQKVYDAIALRLQNETDYDDGSYGPVS